MLEVLRSQSGANKQALTVSGVLEGRIGSCYQASVVAARLCWAVHARRKVDRLSVLFLQMAVDDIEALNYEELGAVAHLAASERYKSITQVRLHVAS